MRHPTALVMLAAGGVLVAAGIIGCTDHRPAAAPAPARRAPAAQAAARSAVAPAGPASPPPARPDPNQHAKAHGGTHNVNGAAFDAMFFRNYGVNPYIDTDDDPLSTFAIDVDAGSYTLVRSYLQRGHLPDRDAVRLEEFVNYFRYDYPPPKDADQAFAIHLAAAPSKFRRDRSLLRVGVKARQIDRAERKPAVLTFVIDVSGSMAREDRLELVKKALGLLVDQLGEGDRIGIAVYGSRARKHLAHRGVEDRTEVLDAIARLGPAGATNADEGIRIGYDMAAAAFTKGAVNRVVLCSDGVANVGRTGAEAILEQIRHHADAGITLTTVGFGMGNYNDVLMERLADAGNGCYAYVDTLKEARRIFADDLTGTLQCAARDVKVQVEFDPKVVRSYRLLGYENRDIADRDFRDDKVDAGEVGCGHSVTALYELKLWPDRGGRLATVRIRHKDADGRNVREVERTVATADLAETFEAAPDSLRLAACVAEFAEVLRSSYWARATRIEDVLAVARDCRRAFDSRGDVTEFAALVEKARALGAGDGKAVADADP